MKWLVARAAAPALPAAIAAVVNGAVVAVPVVYVSKEVHRNPKVIQVLHHLQDSAKQKQRKVQDAAVIPDRVDTAGSMAVKYLNCSCNKYSKSFNHFK